MLEDAKSGEEVSNSFPIRHALLSNYKSEENSSLQRPVQTSPNHSLSSVIKVDIGTESPPLSQLPSPPTLTDAQYSKSQCEPLSPLDVGTSQSFLSSSGMMSPLLPSVSPFCVSGPAAIISTTRKIKMAGRHFLQLSNNSDCFNTINENQVSSNQVCRI